MVQLQHQRKWGKFSPPVLLLSLLMVYRSELEKKIALTWNALPESLRCAEDHWGDPRTPQVSCLLVVNHLEHLYNRFLFCSLCHAQDAKRVQETASIASELLKGLLSIGLQRSKLRKVGLNLAHCVSKSPRPSRGLYGLGPNHHGRSPSSAYLQAVCWPTSSIRATYDSSKPFKDWLKRMLSNN